LGILRWGHLPTAVPGYMSRALRVLGEEAHQFLMLLSWVEPHSRAKKSERTGGVSASAIGIMLEEKAHAILNTRPKPEENGRVLKTEGGPSM